MSKGRQLYELQEVDQDIDARREKLSDIESRLGENSTLQEARARLDRQKQRFDELKGSQREGEWVVEDLRGKVAVLEKRLYGGSVKNPKELSGLQEQTEHLKTKSRQEEERVLDIMAELESTEADLSAMVQEVQHLDKQWQDEQARLARERDELASLLADLEQRRKELSSRIDASSLRLYEELRAKKRGRAVARVEQGMCQGCRIVLPTRELQRARSGQELVQCSSCERILYVS